MASLEVLRTFIAFPTSESLIQKIDSLQSELKKLKLDAKFVDPHKIHLTLKFLGDTPVSSLEKIQKAVEEVAKHHVPFSVSIDTFGAFPNFRAPRVLWVGSQEGSREAENLSGELSEALSAFGFEKEERKFKGHLTLARLRSLKNAGRLSEFGENYVLPWKETFVCEALTHYKSTLTPKGALYEPLCQLSLAAS
ncbi:MAG: RNA 2',3'-cyclic phosphodiesterase [Candidatus Omnitrophota bacterium]